MTRPEFEQIVREMQRKGTPLSMANLMVRTELPRAQIEDWLDGMQRDVKVGPAAAKPRKKSDEDEADDAPGEKTAGGGVMARAKALQAQLMGDVVKSKLGLSDTETKGAKPTRSIRTGATLGIALPPAALIYAAPHTVAVVGTVAYVFLAWLSLKTFVYGGLYILFMLHFAGAILGAGYAWRFNRGGKRDRLLPAESKDDG